LKGRTLRYDLVDENPNQVKGEGSSLIKEKSGN
jgi:ribose 5-phosphate isomerase